jgi:hypothetical protein
MRRPVHSWVAAAALAALLGGAAAAEGQSASAGAPRPGEAATDPIRCWWRTDRTAVRVGERFSLVLTCGVIETPAVTVVAAVNDLEPGAIQITPFEAVSGVRREDVVAPPWRYFQFEYSVRLLSDGFFGQDLNVPALTITYNIRSPGGSSEGRDLGYVLPALPMRVLSLVPRSENDIRDASGQTLARAESRRFRSAGALVAAGILFAFALVVAGVAVVRAVGRYRGRDRSAARPVPVPSQLRGCQSALSRVRSEAQRDGWTPELARRALAAVRVAGALALGRPVAQEFVGPDAAEREGQIAVRSGWPRRRRAMLSAPTTPAGIAAGGNHGARAGARTRAALEDLADALRVLTAAGYGRSDHADPAALEAALDGGARAIRHLHRRSRWPVRTLAAVARSFTGF